MSTLVTGSRAAAPHCPGCLTPTGAGAACCPCCGIWLAGPQADEIRWIDAELTRVDEARTWLISRRARLLDDLTRLRSREPGQTAASAPGVLASHNAGRDLPSDVMRLAHVMPGWVPIAAGGAVLLWAGATYEARLANLQAIRRSLGAMT